MNEFISVLNGTFLTQGSLRSSDCSWTWRNRNLDVPLFIDVPNDYNELFLTFQPNNGGPSVVTPNNKQPDSWSLICEKPTNPKQPYGCPLECLNDGECYITGDDSYSCHCPQNYTGNRCQQGTNDCLMCYDHPQ